MRYGIVITEREPATFADLALQAQQAGWDAVFSWETPYGLDAWVALSAAAVRTSTIRLGTMLTPVPRWKPWHLASTALSLDRLSGGRVILSVGVGAMHEGWTAYEPDPGTKVRAEILDESLDIMFALWEHGSMSYDGTHFKVRPTEMFAPGPPVAGARVTTWCVGMVGGARSMWRAARCDGLLPNFRGDAAAAELADLARWRRAGEEIRRARAGLRLAGPYDLVAEGDFALERWDDAATFAAELAESGYTWYVDSDWSAYGREDEVQRLRARIEKGPPRRREAQ